MACPQCHSILAILYHEMDNDHNDLMIEWKCRNCDLKLVIHYPAQHQMIKKINDVDADTNMYTFTEENRKKHLDYGIVHEYNMAEHVERDTKYEKPDPALKRLGF